MISQLILCFFTYAFFFWVGGGGIFKDSEDKMLKWRYLEIFQIEKHKDN